MRIAGPCSLVEPGDFIVQDRIFIEHCQLAAKDVSAEKDEIRAKASAAVSLFVDIERALTFSSRLRGSHRTLPLHRPFSPKSSSKRERILVNQQLVSRGQEARVRCRRGMA